ncbi:hypothetical protein [Microvirga tunisiensis]|uniref:Uncharacterized protein n=1 Tax=Microvirga tunisiensis TaxID=2108360 RepID=A0A5N7MRX3_9HYPH|nr:hypothetical protein [Microvirga tunisiensis]MPR09237.1 hypothetical protein [Microvirga tunisiensis]MPR29703.1 hypothetical protein [Microvirga tunisiensis]
MQLFIYTPAEDALAVSFIVPKSAIVGLPSEDGQSVLVYYEGNLNKAVNLTRYRERLISAAGRMVVKYPTVAKMLAPATELHQVGTYDAIRHYVIEITDPSRLAMWAGEPVDQIAGARLPNGPCSKETLAAHHDQLRPLGQRGTKFGFRALTGQMVIHDVSVGTSHVYEPDEPEAVAWDPKQL